MTNEQRLPSRFALGAFIGWLATTMSWWALAFAPLPVPETWLAEARAVCFGTLSNGLPDTYGWVLLIMGPASMLAFLLVAFGRELALDVRFLAHRRAGVALLALFVIAPAAGLAWVGDRVAAGLELTAASTARPIESGLPDGYPRTERPAPALDLIDQHGEVSSIASLSGRPAVVTFAYAHCATICPVVVETVRSAAESLGPDAPGVAVVTLDPWRDTPSRLPHLAESWHLDEIERARVLSGEVDDVLATLEAWEMPISRDDRTGEIAHPGLVYVLDAEGQIAYTFNNPPRAWVAEAVKRLNRDHT